jgi:hypothetical protein
MSENDLQELFDKKMNQQIPITAGLFLLGNVQKRLIFKWFCFGYELGCKSKSDLKLD